MEKTLKTFSVNVSDILINGRVLHSGDELVFSFPNGYEHLFVGYEIHYRYEHPDYEVVLNLYSKENDRYKLYIRKENQHCSRAYKLVNSESNEEEIYPLIGESMDEIQLDKFAIFDIHSVKKQVTLRDCPFSCNFKNGNENDNRFLFCTMYDCGNGDVKDSVLMLHYFDVVDDEIVRPNFFVNLKKCYVSREEYLLLNSSKKVTIEVYKGESSESILEKVKKELEKN